MLFFIVSAIRNEGIVLSIIAEYAEVLDAIINSKRHLWGREWILYIISNPPEGEIDYTTEGIKFKSNRTVILR